MSTEDQRVANLLNSYDSVGELIKESIDLEMSDLILSRSFFSDESIDIKQPFPREVDVYAILSGISFNIESQIYIENILLALKKLLKDELFFFVNKKNLGVEYVVIKWPEDSYKPELIEEAKNFLKNWNGGKFTLRIVGIQIHLDGCIVLKGIDLGGEIFNFRKKLISTVPELPLKQSKWAHIPLGRILAPIGKDKMIQLKTLLDKLNNSLEHDVLIDKIHFVNEKRWYMEEKNFLITKTLK